MRHLADFTPGQVLDFRTDPVGIGGITGATPSLGRPGRTVPGDRVSAANREGALAISAEVPVMLRRRAAGQMERSDADA